MTNSFTPFREIHDVDDLLLIDTATSCGDRLSITDAYYPEICLWVQINCTDLDFFSDDGQTLVDGIAGDGFGWRLSLGPRGYLRFEDKNPDQQQRQSVDSHLPVHAVVDSSEEIRLGFCLDGSAWAMRDTRYAAQGDASMARLRIFAVSGPGAGITEIGGKTGIDRTDLNPVPETLLIGTSVDGTGEFGGTIERLTAYNTSRLELFDAPHRPPADDAVPLIPCGSTFMPRWVDDETVEVFSRPEFVTTMSYWIHLPLDGLKDARRLRLWTKWYGGVNMTPTFFWSRDGDRWKRVTPVRAWMGDERTNFRVEFDLDDFPARDGFLASAPPFLQRHREELIEWVGGQEGVSVSRIGESVLGRPLHAISVGDPPAEHGVAVICGQHSPLEIMGGRVIRPVLKRLLEDAQLLETCAFFFVPTVNVDCQHYGGNGLNANRRNTNRHWMVDLQPANRACVEFFDALAERGQNIDFALDIHAGGIFRNHPLMHMGQTDEVSLSGEQKRRQEQWRDLLEKHAGLRREDGWALDQLDLRATDYFHQAHGATAFCLELSTCSYYDPSIGQSRPFGQEAFELLAKGLVAAWREFFLGI